MKIKNKIISGLLSVITFVSATLSALPLTASLTVSAATYTRAELGWNQITYDIIHTINKDITSLSTTSGVNTTGKGTNRTNLKSYLNQIQDAGYTFNFSGRIKPQNQYIVVFDGDNDEQLRVSLNDSNFYTKLNTAIKNISNESFNHVINYDTNRGTYYGSDESTRKITAISMDGASNNRTENVSGFSIYDNRSYIGIAHNETGKDYFIKLPDKNKCKIGMLYKNGGSYIDTKTGDTVDVDVMVMCNNYDYSDEEVPYLSTGSSVSSDDNDWAYLTADMVTLLKNNGLAITDMSRRSDKLIYRKLPDPITKVYNTGHDDYPTVSYKYEYVIPTYLISEATRMGIFNKIETYLHEKSLPGTTKNYHYPRRTQYTKRYITNVPTACLRFTDERPGIYGGLGNWYDLKYSFFKAGTNEPVAVSGYSCWKDVDGQQGVSSTAFADTITTSSGTIPATGAWETSANTSVKRYNWSIDGNELTGYFDYKITNSSPSDISNWVFATFEKRKTMNVVYSFWGAFSDTQKNRLNMVPSGWMMCDLPGPERNFYANYRVQKLARDSKGNSYPIKSSEYGSSQPVFNIGFVLTDENGYVCKLSKSTDNNGTTIDRGSYIFSKVLTTKDLTDSSRTLLRANDAGYVTLNNLPLGKYRLVEAVTTKTFNGNQAIPAAQMIFSDPDAPGNHCSDSFNGATVKVTNSAVSVTCHGDTIYPVTTDINVSHIKNFETDSQDYISGGKYFGTNADGTINSSIKVNAIITNITSTSKIEFNLQKTITQTDGNVVEATSKLIDGISFAITNANGDYAKVVNGNFVGWVDKSSSTPIKLDSYGQLNFKSALYDFPFGKYKLIEKADNESLKNIWDINRTIELDINESECTLDNDVYSYEISIDNPELYGGFTVKKTTETGADISGIRFWLSGTSDSGRKVRESVITDSNGYGIYDKVPVGTYTLSEDPDTVPDGWTVAPNRTVSIVSGQTAEASITEVENTPKKPDTGTIKITKIDSETANLLEGAEFTVYKDENNNQKYDVGVDLDVATQITVASGIAQIEDLAVGSYFVKETKAPDGYIIDDNYYFVTVQKDVTVTVKTNDNGFANTPIKGNIKLTKVDSENTSNKLTGAVFRVFKDVDGNGHYQSAVDTLVDTLINNGDGTYVIDNLPYGKYVVRESKAPTGYKLDVKNYPVNITENGMTYIVNNITGTELFGNEPIKGNIKLTKVDSDTNIKLSGAEFTVYTESGTEVAKMTEDNGVYTMSDLLYGKYIVRETKAPEGYVKDTKDYPVEITENGMTYILSNIAETEMFGNPQIKARIRLTKVDLENIENKLSGAIFKIFKDNDGNGKFDNGDEWVAFMYEDENNKGNYIAKKQLDGEEIELPYGNYVVRESVSPEGYIKDNTDYPVSITENGKVYIISNIARTELFGNPPIKGNVKLTKVDSENTSVKLTGAIFKVFSDVNGDGKYDSGDKQVAVMTENPDGVYTASNLRYGKYIIKESTAPEGYVKDTKDYPVEITKNGMTYIVSNIAETELFGNPPIKGNVKLTKVDSENTSVKLTGAIFKVFSDVNGDGKYDSEVDTAFGTMSENNGVYSTSANVPYGKYLVKETKAPEGYVLDTNYYPVSITENGKAHIVSNIEGTELFGNPLIKGSIKLTKVNSEKTGMKLTGAIFRVYKDVDGDEKYDSEVDTAFGTMSENNGVYSTSANVPYGKYLVKEIKAPEGYVLDTNYYPVSITENGKAHIVSNIEGTELFGNPLIRGSIKLTKVNSEKTGMKLTGAIFRVYKDVDGDGKYNSEIDTAFGTMSENNGVYSTSANVPYGKYLVKETKAPEGYVLDTNYYPVSITENGKAHIVSNIEGTELLGNVPIKGSIKVTKVDSNDTDLKLSGAIFRVYKDVDGDGRYNSEVDTAFGTMSENNGVYSTSANVPYGKYIVREVKAPTGYYQDTKDYPVNITENGKVYVVANIPNTKLFGNKPKPVSITLTKRIPVDEVNGDIWFEHGNPTFVLKLVNTTPGENYNRTFYKAVEFTKEYVKSNTITVDGKKYVEMSVTYDNMPAGTFTALEVVAGQRYQLKELLNTVNGVVNGNVVNFTLKPGENGAATFYNVKSSFDTNTHNSLCVNVLKK